jgi:TolA-binding protein
MPCTKQTILRIHHDGRAGTELDYHLARRADDSSNFFQEKPMKTTRYLLTICGLTLALSCASRKEEEKEISPQEQARLDRQQSASEISETSKKLDKERRDYAVRVEQQLDQLEANIVELKAKSPTGKNRKNYRAQVADLEGRVDEARGQLTDLKKAPASEFDRRHQQMEATLSGLNSVYETTSSQIAH